MGFTLAHGFGLYVLGCLIALLYLRYTEASKRQQIIYSPLSWVFFVWVLIHLFQAAYILIWKNRKPTNSPLKKDPQGIIGQTAFYYKKGKKVVLGKVTKFNKKKGKYEWERPKGTFRRIPGRLTNTQIHFE